MTVQLATEWPNTPEVDLHGTSPIAEAVSLIELVAKPPNPEATLLGQRFLCRGGGLLFVGPSGIGKSSASVQQDILWGLGRPAFGILPARPLRVLTVQAENDEGDLSEMACGVSKALNLSSEDKASISDSVLYVSERSRTGLALITQVLAPLLEKHCPDLLRLDPLLAYLGADVNDAKETAAFLRNGLNPLLEEYACGAIINHHTPKVTNRDTTNWRSSDWMYAGAGSADVTNWARAILVIDPTHASHVFRFIAAKRGGRIGWCDENGIAAYERLFCHHNAGRLAWRDASAEDVMETEIRKPKRGGVRKKKEDLLGLVPVDRPIPKQALISQAGAVGIGMNAARGFISELLNSKELYVWGVPRSGSNPEKYISREPAPDNRDFHRDLHDPPNAVKVTP